MRRLPLALLLCLLLAPAQAKNTGREEATRAYFTDTPLMTQRGESVRFYTDVLKERLVVINFIYTRCEHVCPTTTQKLAELAARVSGTIPNLRLVSISIDPEHDTPARLQTYAEQFGPRPEWLLLTGEKGAVETVVARLGQLTPEVEAHSTLFLMGDVAQGSWSKVFGFATADQLEGELRRIANGNARE